MTAKGKKLFLIDGNSFCYRAYYAIKNLSTSSGQPTGAIYGFMTMMNKLIHTEQPDFLAVAFDLKAPTFRHRKFADYKIHRKPMPDELIEQMPIIKKVIAAYSISIFEMEGFEADDIIATLAKAAAREKIEVYIVTGDKDVLQLVNRYIKVYSPHKEDLIYDVEKVKGRFGVGPESIPEVMALMGDPTDNIPGVPGIGEKTAVELIKKFGTLEAVLSNAEKIEHAARQRALREFANQARMSRELAIVDCNVPIEFDLQKLKIGTPDRKKLLELFKELEFKNLIKEFSTGEPRLLQEAHYTLVSEVETFDRVVQSLEGIEEFAVDFETTAPDPLWAELVGVSFCSREGESYYVPVSRDSKSKGIKLDYLLRKLRPLFEDTKIKKIGQNIKYEVIVLAKHGISLRGISFDTMVASYLLNPSKLNHNLGDISLEWLNHKMIELTELIGKGKNQISMADVELNKVCRYSCEDSDVTFRLKHILEDELKKKGLDHLFYNVEIPLIDVLASMEMEGVSIDTAFLGKMSVDMEKDLEELTQKIYTMAGCQFNINSSKQLGHILFDTLQLPTIKRTKTGASTDVEVLEKLSALHPLPAALVTYRELSKLKSTYVDALPKLVNAATGRVHTSFNQTVTVTGRLSSSQPNIQNIPIKGEIGRHIRKAFVPREETSLLLSADYSQIELRILAHLSGDENLIRAFEKDLDIHTHTASLIFGIEEKEVTSEMRATAKTVNFGIIYGMSPYGLSRDLRIDAAEAKDFIGAYFERYPGVKRYIARQIEDAKEKGYVTTLLGRRRYIPEITSKDVSKRQFAERAAINTPIQGSAADLIKVAMIHIYNEFNHRELSSKMILQVHDELVFEVPNKETQTVKELIKQKMEGVIALQVPIKVRIKTGKNWLEVK